MKNINFKRFISVLCALVLLVAAVFEPTWFGKTSKNMDEVSAADATPPTDFTEISWTDFGNITYKEYLAPSPDLNGDTAGAYSTSLHQTLLNGNITLGAGADIRYAGSNGWYGLVIRAWAEEGEYKDHLLISTGGFGTQSLNEYFAPEDYGLTTFIDTEFNLKISTEISGDSYTFGIWVNDKMLGDYLTLTASYDGNNACMAGNVLGLYHAGGNNNITLKKAPVKVPTGLTEISWTDFSGLLCQEYVNPQASYGTYSDNLDGTLFNGNIILGSDADIRYAGQASNPGWSGLIIRAKADGTLLVNNSTFDTSYNIAYNPADYGLTSFVGKEFNLKISTEINGNNYTFGIWVNNKIVGDYFTLTESEGANGNILGIYGAGNNITLKEAPKEEEPDFTELRWTDFGFEYKEYVTPSPDASKGTIGTYSGSLDRTLLNGNIILDEESDIRYAGQTSNPGWSGLVIRAQADGTLLVNGGTFDTFYNEIYNPAEYGLTSFVDKEFNLKISTEKNGNKYTFGIWVNDKMLGDYFTLTESDGDTGSIVGLNDTNSNGNITLNKPTLNVPTDLTEIRWTDFGNISYKEYVAPSPDLNGDTAGAYASGLDGTLLNGNIILGEGTEIRFAGNDGWQGIVIRADAAEETYGQLYVVSNGLQAEGTSGYEQRFVPEDYGLTSFIDEEFNLKISTEVDGSKYTFGIWVNNKILGDYFTLTVDSTKVGHVLGLYDCGTGHKVILKKPPLQVPTDYTELRWADFTGLKYKEYVAPVPDVSGDTAGTYSGNLNKTLLNGNIILGANTDIRYAGNNGWSGLVIRALDSGKLLVNASTFDTTYNVEYDPEVYGLTSFVGNEFNLKISTKINGNKYTFGIWVNDKILGDYFTLTDDEDTTTGGVEAGKVLGLYHNEKGNNITLINASVAVPKDFTEISWTDFTGLSCQEYVKPQGINGIYEDDLNETLFNGNIIMGSTTEVRFAGSSDPSVRGWFGLLIRALDSGKLLVNSSTFDTAYNVEYDPKVYGLTSFVGEEFNLKISTEIVGNNYTFGIWVNDKILGDYFTLAEAGADAGNVLGLAYEAKANNVILKAAPAELPVDFNETSWSDYEILTPLTSFGIAAGAYEMNTNDSVDRAPLSSIEKFDKVILQFHKITFEGDADLGFGGENVWVGFRLRSNSTDGTLALQSGYSGAAGHNQLISTPIVMHDAVAGVDLVGGTYNLKISMVYTNDTTIKMGIWFNDMLYNNNYIFIDISGINTYEAGDVLGNHLGVVCQSEGGGTITFGEEEVTLKPVYWNMADGAYTVPSTTTDGDGNSITELSTVGDHHITYTLNGKICDRDIYIWEIGNVKVDNETDACDLVRTKKIAQNKDVDATNAGVEAADFDKNGTVDATDVHCMRRLLLGDTFDYGQTLSEKMLGAGKENVMPILGYYGPSAPWSITATDGISYTSKDTVTADIYDLIARTGINIITASNDAYSDANKELIEKHLSYATARGLSLFVRDGRVDGSKEISHEELQYYLDGYEGHESFAGMFLVDEPKSDTYLEDHNRVTFDEWAALGKKINQYGNLTGYVNLHPYYEDFYRENDESTSSYQEYLTDYIEKFEPQYLSFDHYLFSSKKWNYTWFKWRKSTENKNVDSSDYYVQNLAMVRNAANDAGIPFWSVVQAGSNWNDSIELLDATTNTTPTQGQFYWQINMALAFGAKGITYFPMIQPHYFALTEDGTMDYDRNGLIAEDGSTTVWYDYTVKANKQIAAIDEVLMNATNKGVIPVSGYAANIITSSLNSLGDANLVRGSYGELSSVSTTGTTYGAVVGCFDYNGKTALYVVNYDVNSSRDITLNFTGSVTADVTINGAVSEKSGSSITLSIGAGEGALVVLK